MESINRGIYPTCSTQLSDWRPGFALSLDNCCLTDLLFFVCIVEQIAKRKVISCLKVKISRDFFFHKLSLGSNSISCSVLLPSCPSAIITDYTTLPTVYGISVANMGQPTLPITPYCPESENSVTITVYWLLGKVPFKALKAVRRTKLYILHFPHRSGLFTVTLIVSIKGQWAARLRYTALFIRVRQFIAGHCIPNCHQFGGIVVCPNRNTF